VTSGRRQAEHEELRVWRPFRAIDVVAVLAARRGKILRADGLAGRFVDHHAALHVGRCIEADVDRKNDRGERLVGRSVDFRRGRQAACR
jgi:hypothetical protein